MKLSSNQCIRFALSGTLVVALGGELPAQTVRGSVFDSLTMSRVARASVWVQGGSQNVVADSNGYFEMTGVPSGEHYLAFSTPTLDSLGLGTLGARVKVDTNGARDVLLASPSFLTIARALCRERMAGADSAIVWGIVLDADSGIRLQNARAAMEWSTPVVGQKKQVSIASGSREARTDSTGTYYACGLPAETQISIQATGTKSASNVVQYTIGPQRILRLDLLVSRETAAALTTDESVGTAERAKGTATISGTVRDDSARAIGNATVEVSSVDRKAVTNADGQFTLSELPAGTTMLEVRQIGFAPQAIPVDLLPGKTVGVAPTLKRVTNLAAVEVRANTMARRDRDDFEFRRLQGVGYARTEKDFVGRSLLSTVLQELPNLSVRSNRGIPEVRSRYGAQCDAIIWIDGVRTSIDHANSIPLEDFRAVEWFPRGGYAPEKFQHVCPVLIFWTIRARWGNP